jgi:hypothetical protein
MGEQGTGYKGARACGGGRRTRGRGHVHGGDVGERLGTADGWDPRGRERKRARAKRNGADRLAPIEQREGERERRGARVGADRQGPPVRDQGRVGRARGAGPDGPTWSEMAFPFSGEFLIDFLFIFSRVFN